MCPITGAVEMMSRPLARDLVAVAETTDKPIFVVWGSPVGTERAYTEVLLGSPLPVFRTFHNCVQAVRACSTTAGFSKRYRSPFTGAPTEPLPAARRARRLLAVAAPGRLAVRARLQAVLKAYGVRPSRDRLCTSAAQAVTAAEQLGYPVVMKACSSALPHKSDLGLVAVGVAIGQPRSAPRSPSCSDAPPGRWAGAAPSTACWCARWSGAASRWWSASPTTRCSARS